MIEVVLHAGKFYHPTHEKVDSVKSLLPPLQEGFTLLKEIRKGSVVELFQKFSDNILKDPSTKGIEGVPFLSAWLRKSNLIQIIEKNLKDIGYLDAFTGDKKRIKAQPRGVVSHWIAGNVPTIGLFSLFQSMLVGNANIMRVPPKSHETLVRLLHVFAETRIETGVSGALLLKSVAIIYYDKADAKANEDLSDIADARVVWGGEEAVKAITNVPRRAHCEDIIFGPKYSLAVMDAAAVKSENLGRTLKFLASDIFLFDQAACTSPHVVFCEKEGADIASLARMLGDEMAKLAKRFPKIDVDQFIMTRIINARAEHALDPAASVVCSPENDWTILINQRPGLEEPIESRTVYLKVVDSIMDVVPLITKKVQTIGCAIDDKAKLLAFADEATFRGVARCVNIGQMHLFDSPWDGMLFMSRLVNWVTLYHGD
ncbi:MAG: acyl-CoA reductase [Candidatus Lokiarchaeota archaeon]|nr:acyl-CoA reductase [Candidatus Lokiarchaeota archaeon]